MSLNISFHATLKVILFLKKVLSHHFMTSKFPQAQSSTFHFQSLNLASLQLPNTLVFTHIMFANPNFNRKKITSLIRFHCYFSLGLPLKYLLHCFSNICRNYLSTNQEVGQKPNNKTNRKHHKIKNVIKIKSWWRIGIKRFL